MNTPDTVAHQSALNVAKWKDLKELELDAVQSVWGELSVEALHWLFSMSSNPTVQSIIFQAIGGVHPASQRKAEDLFGDAGLLLQNSLSQCLSITSHPYGAPLSGLETKLERLLRCKLVLSDECYIFINLPQTQGIELPSNVTALIERYTYNHDINLLMEDIALNGALAFRHLSGAEYLRFHPLVWIDLIRNAASAGVFSPIDISAEDPFAMNICCAVLPAFSFFYSNNSGDSEKDKAQSTAVALYVAICDHFFTDMTTYLLEMFAAFVRPSNVDSVPPCLRILLVFAEFLISRLPLNKEANPDAEELHVLDRVINGIMNHDHSSSQANAAVFDVLERFVTEDNLRMIPMVADSSLCLRVLQVYSRLLHKRWHTVSPRSLEAVVDLMFNSPYSSTSAGDIIAKGLHEGSLTMYNVFRAKQCLEYFGHHGYRSWLVNIIGSYLSTIGHHSKSRLKASVEQEHIDYLHTPDNLFAACSILAVGCNDRFNRNFNRRKQIRENILSLVRIQQDNPVWDECRCRLQQLLENDGMDFFYRQARIRGIERVALSGEKIAEQREYIRFTIETLDAFFSGELDEEPISDPPALSVDVLPNPRPHWSSRMHRLLPWHNHEASDGGAVGNV
ncbi:uncharacterized protein EV420DRAFT_1638802 [Desarmillaria tabescens]|uniref:Uncharacterized protein n=1 Tax=Armillaria tabescens TaxID=1929756 RepID=A0AA39NDZ4_ARMTA|nr:uncharacterized protein EV420DRAFT_1638802 [Desarmillaria tabescens]KAK0463877.1 hypothetical protein EV420DRAFT_1638802 [Desarmillaria tabescens]